MGVFNKSESVNHETTVIASGAIFKGEISVNGNIHIDGNVEGNISTTTNVSIGNKGAVKGEVKAKKMIISGFFEGKANCHEIEILKDGSLKGEIVVENIIIEKGGDFSGICHKKDKELTVKK